MAIYYFFADLEGLVSALAMANENSSSSFGTFPLLVIDQSDISGSWKRFSDEFLLLQELEINSRYFNNPRNKW